MFTVNNKFKVPYFFKINTSIQLIIGLLYNNGNLYLPFTGTAIKECSNGGGSDAALHSAEKIKH